MADFSNCFLLQAFISSTRCVFSRLHRSTKSMLLHIEHRQPSGPYGRPRAVCPKRRSPLQGNCDIQWWNCERRSRRMFGGSAVRCACQYFLHRPQGDAITLRPQARDYGGSHLRDQGMVIDRFAAMNVGNVQFDDWACEHLQRIENRNRREREGSRIDDDAAAAVGGLMDPVDQLGLAVRLPKLDGMPVSRIAALRLDLRQCRAAVDFRFPAP